MSTTDIPKASEAERARVLRPHDPLVTDAELLRTELAVLNRRGVNAAHAVTAHLSNCAVAVEPCGDRFVCRFGELLDVGPEPFITSPVVLHMDLETLLHWRAAVDELLGPVA